MSEGSLTRLPRPALFRGRSGTAAVSEAERSTIFRWLVRVGFMARGLTYGVIGALAIALASGAGTAGAAPDQQGALTLLARAPMGFVALIVIAAGFFSYACWKLGQAFSGHGPEGGGGGGIAQRLANGAGGIAYLLLCAVAVRVLVGSGRSSSGSPAHATAGVLGWPAGPWLVGLAGVILIGASIYQAYYGLSCRFERQVKTAEMGPDERRLFLAAGRAGLVARAVVFALCGYFLVQSALTFNPGSAVGVDGALARLHHQTLGPWLVGLVGLGLLIFAAFSLYEARYRRL